MCMRTCSSCRQTQWGWGWGLSAWPLVLLQSKYKVWTWLLILFNKSHIKLKLSLHLINLGVGSLCVAPGPASNHQGRPSWPGARVCPDARATPWFIWEVGYDLTNYNSQTTRISKTKLMFTPLVIHHFKESKLFVRNYSWWDYSQLPIRLVARRTREPAFTEHRPNTSWTQAFVGWHYLSNATCIIWPHLLYALLIV